MVGCRVVEAAEEALGWVGVVRVVVVVWCGVGGEDGGDGCTRGWVHTG